MTITVTIPDKYVEHIKVLLEQVLEAFDFSGDNNIYEKIVEDIYKQLK